MIRLDLIVERIVIEASVSRVSPRESPCAVKKIAFKKRQQPAEQLRRPPAVKIRQIRVERVSRTRLLVEQLWLPVNCRQKMNGLEGKLRFY